MAQTKNAIEVVNKIEISGSPEVLFDSISDEEKKQIVQIMSERIMNPIGFRIRGNGVSV